MWSVISWEYMHSQMYDTARHEFRALQNVLVTTVNKPVQGGGFRAESEAIRQCGKLELMFGASEVLIYLPTLFQMELLPIALLSFLCFASLHFSCQAFPSCNV